MKILKKAWLGITVIIWLFLTACGSDSGTGFQHNPPGEPVKPNPPISPPVGPDKPDNDDPDLSGSSLRANTATSNRTRQTVWNLYQATLAELAFSTNDLFTQEPVISTSPHYRPGELSSPAVNTALNLLNTYRALYGINDDITAHPERFDWGQYGATAEEIIGRLTHDIAIDQADKAKLLTYMTAEELDKAVAATGAGYDAGSDLLWSGNVSSTNNVVLSVKRYIDEINNVIANSAGHRFSMLDLTGEYAVFGAGLNKYSAMNIYGDPDETINSEDYYAWPPEGWFPKQALPDDAPWSIVLGRKYRSSVEGRGDYDEQLPYSSEMKVHVSYDGVEAGADALSFASNYDDDFPTITFAPPAFVKESIKSSSSAYDNAGVVEVTVTVTGIRDSQGRDHYLRYATRLFQELN